MKKLILTFAVLMGVSTVINTFAHNNYNGIKIVDLKVEASELQLQTLKGLKFQLTLDNLDKRTSIAIKNSEGEVFYSEFIGNLENFNKFYDLSALPDGSYFFEVITGKERLVKNFKIATNVIRTANAQ